MTIPEPRYTQTKRTRAVGVMQQEQKKTPHAYVFSVIVCTYNRCKLVLATLTSLQQQTLPHHLFEVIIVDNGSNDGTAEAIEAYFLADHHVAQREEARHMRYVKETQNGLAYARNTGVRHASGDIVVFLDDDIFADSSFLACLLATYEETGADAVGGSVDLLWEASQPYWFSDNLLEMLGYFQPFAVRTQVPVSMSLSKRNFSVRRTLLLEMRGFVPFLGKCLDTPVSREVAYLCQCLHREGYSLWYDPTIRVMHRVSQAQLKRTFFIGRAYWDGRGDIMAIYADRLFRRDRPAEDLWGKSAGDLRGKLAGYGTFLLLAFLHRPLLALARKSAHERLMAAMAQSYLWGCIRQRLSLMNRAPATIARPDILLLQAHEQDGLQLQQGFQAAGLDCVASIACLPLCWLWRHRSANGKSAGVIHCYRPGAFPLNHWQRQRFILRLWLAQRMGIPVVTTDAGGWWQHVRTVAARQHQAFEQHLLRSSHLILSYSSHLSQLYPDLQLRKRVYSLSHPGLYGLIPNLVSREEAIRQLYLAIPAQPQPFIYLCFAQHHCEREMLSLIEAFSEAQATFSERATHTIDSGLLHLIIVGTPCDKRAPEKMVQYAAKTKHIHISLRQETEDISLYVAATDAVVLPHMLARSAGTLDTVYLWYSYEKVVIVPDLPRFVGVFPSHACLLYDPGSHTSLVQALQRAVNHTYRHLPEERNRLSVRKAWQRHVERLQALHKLLLFN